MWEGGREEGRMKREVENGDKWEEEKVFKKLIRFQTLANHPLQVTFS